MGLRYLNPAFYHEISQRANEGAFKFDPNDAELRDAFYGVLAYAAWYYGVQVLAFHFMTNHYHGLYGFECPRKFSMFLSFLHAGFARSYHRIHGTSNKLWSYMTWNPVAKDAASVRRRLKYIMGQATATAASMVKHPDEFQGASSLDWMLHGKVLTGVRFDSTQKSRDRNRLAGGAKPDEAYKTRYELTITPPSAWAELSPQELRTKYWEIADELADEARIARENAERKRAETEAAERKREEEEAAEREQASADSPEPIAEPEQKSADQQGNVQEQPAVDADPPASQMPRDKVKTPMPTDESGDPLVMGKVKPKLADGTFGRARRPKLLAADRAVVQAFEDEYAACCQTYREAKEEWRSKAKYNEHGVLSAQITLPPYMMIGTMPLRLPGDRRPAKAE